MNKNQKEVEKAKLTAEQKTLDRLKNEYGQAAKEIDEKVKGLQDDIKDLNLMLQDAIDIGDTEQVNIVKSRIQSKVYQKNYQQALSKQVGGIVDNMNKKQYDTVSGYLKGCYETGYVGTMYDIAGQGIPIIQPIDQKAISKAIKLDSKVSKKLYGSYVTTLKKRIQSEISRGIATAKTFQEISRDLHNQTNIGMNKAMRIARTEGHRIQNVSSNDAREVAKDKGADVLKQWDAAMDKRTRRSHAEVDGEIRETDEAFSNGMMFAGDPAGGASEVVNCRCATLTRARWALDDDELETLKQRAEFYGLDKTKNFADYQKKYLKVADDVKNDKFEEITIDGTVGNIDKEELKKVLKNTVGLDGFEEKYNQFKNMTIKEMVSSYEKIMPKKLKRIRETEDEIKKLKLTRKSNFTYNSSIRKQLPSMEDDILTKKIMDDLKVPSGKAKEFISDVRYFTRNGYKNTRDMLDTSISATHSRKALEDFIKASPKYDGTIYRGIKFDSETGEKFVNQLSNGAELDMNGISSWSSSKEYAQQVASNHDLDYQILFSCKNKSGVGIEHISTMPEEMEVLQSSKSKFKIIDIKHKGNHYVIDMEEI